jgi:small-conductance mechanosensitive channel
MVNIPLTVFAFLGGALAIGLGFGTQVLLKNLVSGLMLLVERPLRVGDRVEVGTVVGWVTDIGVRSSTIRTNEGIEILVPNSTFIENNVTNWTYSNAAVRRSVKVGVEYGASPDQVRDLLLQVCARHDEVLADPEPRVLFEDFGTDALIFNLQYWIVYSQGNDGAQVASDLRFMIKRSLAEAGIGIPFPQRVIHFAPGASTPSAQRLAPVPATTEESGYP